MRMGEKFPCGGTEIAADFHLIILLALLSLQLYLTVVA